MRVPTLLVVLPILIGTAVAAYYLTAAATSWVFGRWVYPRLFRRLGHEPCDSCPHYVRRRQ